LDRILMTLKEVYVDIEEGYNWLCLKQVLESVNS
jgi:hypothetical protein